MSEFVVPPGVPASALRKTSPLKPGELGARLKLSPFLVSTRIKLLAQRGLVTIAGKTSQRQVHLGKAKASPARKPNGSTTRPAAAASSIDVVEELDGTVLSNLKAAGRVGRTVREIQISNSDQGEAAILRSLTRLKVKKKADVCDNGRWTAA